jgi:hypothetical protein
MMRRFAWLTLTAIPAALVALAVPSGAAADGTRTDPYPAGPYTVTVTRQDPVEVSTSIVYTVVVSPGDGARLSAQALPGAGTSAHPGRATTAAGNGPDTYTVTTSYPTRGTWALSLDVTGPRGHGQAEVPVAVSAPGAIPTWLGWAIGLSPLLGLAVFLGFQVRTARRLRSITPRAAAERAA